MSICQLPYLYNVQAGHQLPLLLSARPQAPAALTLTAQLAVAVVPEMQLMRMPLTTGPATARQIPQRPKRSLHHPACHAP